MTSVAGSPLATRGRLNAAVAPLCNVRGDLASDWLMSLGLSVKHVRQFRSVIVRPVVFDNNVRLAPPVERAAPNVQRPRWLHRSDAFLR